MRANKLDGGLCSDGVACDVTAVAVSPAQLLELVVQVSHGASSPVS